MEILYNIIIRNNKAIIYCSEKESFRVLWGNYFLQKTIISGKC